MSLQFQMQARSSTNGLLYTWITATPDFGGSAFPGPGVAQHVAVATRISSDDGGTSNTTEINGNRVPWKAAARFAITANVASLSSFTVATSEGTAVAGDRILLTGQTTAGQNGPYTVGVVTSGTAPLTRASDMASSADCVVGSTIAVSEGTLWSNTVWILGTQGAVTLGSTALVFTPDRALTTAALRLVHGKTTGQTAHTQAYAVFGDQGGGIWDWHAGNTDTDNDCTCVGSGSSGRWKRRFSGAINVAWAGARGNGVTEDQVAIQKALNVALAAGGGSVELATGATYLIRGTLVLDGSVSLLSNGAKILYDAAGEHVGGFDGSGDGNPCIVHIGRNVAWTGKLKVDFEQVGIFTYLYVLQIRSAHNFAIEGCNLTNVRAATGGSAISMQFNDSVPGAATRGDVTHGRILNNNVIFHPDTEGMESTSLQNGAVDILYSGNHFVGSKDDAIALHGGDKIRILGNHIETKLGRILIEHATNVLVSNNVFIKRNSGGNSGGIYIFSNQENVYNENIIVTNNFIINDDEAHDITNPIYMSQVKGALIKGNVCVNARGAGAFTFFALAANFSGTYYASENVSIRDNHVFGGTFDISNNTFRVPPDGGPFICSGNMADGGGFSLGPPMHSQITAANHMTGWNNYGFNPGGGFEASREVGDGFTNGQTIATASATNITTNSDLTLTGTSVPYVYSSSKMRLIRVRVSFSAPTATTGVLNVYAYNGTTTTLIASATIPTTVRYADVYNFDLSSLFASAVTIPAGSGIKLNITSAGLGGIDAYASIIAEPCPY